MATEAHARPPEDGHDMTAYRESCVQTWMSYLVHSEVPATQLAVAERLFQVDDQFGGQPPFTYTLSLMRAALHSTDDKVRDAAEKWAKAAADAYTRQREQKDFQ